MALFNPGGKVCCQSGWWEGVLSGGDRGQCPQARVADLDIRHAVANAVRAVRQGDDRVLLIGPDRRGALLDVVVLDGEDEPPAVIHAMKRDHLR